MTRWIIVARRVELTDPSGLNGPIGAPAVELRPPSARAGLALRLFGREGDHSVRRADVDREAVEEVTAEQTVAGAWNVVGRHTHAPHFRVADLQRIDDDEADGVAASNARHARAPDRTRQRRTRGDQRARVDHRAVGAGVEQEL